MKVLLLADISVHEALGSKLVRAASKLERKVEVAYTSPSKYYSPSMSNVAGKIFYRLADRRSLEWWEFQNRLERLIEKDKPDMVLVTGILPLRSSVFHAIHVNRGLIVNYMTDDPWNNIHRRRCFLKNIKEYDHIFSTKEGLRSRLKDAGAKGTSWLPFAYDPTIHHEPKGHPKTTVDVAFVGTGDKERLPWLRAVRELEDISCRLHGNNWERYKTPGWQRCDQVTGEEYCNVIGSARIVLGLLRQENGDLSTDRSYEIGAIGGCGLYQDSSEHRKLLTDYPDEGFFSDPEELRYRVDNLLKDEELRNRLRLIGAAAIRKYKNTYAARLESILDWGESQL